MEKDTASGAGMNPTRPTFRQSQRLARELTERAFQALAEVMEDEAAAATARVTAANTILEWGHGKRGLSTSTPTTVEKIVAMKLKGE